MLVASQIGPQLLSAAMVFDGVLERHPGSTVVVEEVGIDWLPHLVTALEVMIGRTPEILVDDEYRPSHLGAGRLHAAADAGRVPAPPGAGHAAARRRTRSPGSSSRSRPDLLLLQRLPARRGHERRGRALRAPAPRRVEEDAREAFFGGVADLLGV